jgi:uncharacterized cupredoxin-like copper-binding protein
MRVSERDFSISAPKRASAGDVVLQVHNTGPDDHELIVVRTADGRLPFRGDGVTVDEEALQRQEVGTLEPGEPGGTRELRVHLAPGRYVFFCNMSGHYLGGMHTELVVH